jgi:hypothetical protein
LIDTLLAAALQGDTAAAKLLLDRVSPSLRPTDAPVSLPPTQDPAEAAQAVTAAMNAGNISPGEAATALSALKTASEVALLADLEQRIAALEQRST